MIPEDLTCARFDGGQWRSIPTSFAELCWFYDCHAVPSMPYGLTLVNLIGRFVEGFDECAAVCLRMRREGEKRIRVMAVFCVEPHGPIPLVPTHFVDICAVEAEKVRLLKRHASQEEALQKALGAGFDKLCGRPDAYWGEKAGCEFAEVFVPMAARGTIKPF